MNTKKDEKKFLNKFSKNKFILLGALGILGVGAAVTIPLVVKNNSQKNEKIKTAKEFSNFNKEIENQKNTIFDNLLKLQDEKFKTEVNKMSDSEGEQVNKKLENFKNDYEAFLTEVETFYTTKFSSNLEYKKQMSEFINSQKETISGLFKVINDDEIKTLLNKPKKEYIINNNQKLFDEKNLEYLEFVLNDKILGFELGKIHEKMSSIIDEWASQKDKEEEVKTLIQIFTELANVKQITPLVEKTNEVLKRNNKTEITISEKAKEVIKLQTLNKLIQEFKAKKIPENEIQRKEMLKDKEKISSLFKEVSQFLNNLDFVSTQKVFYEDFIERMEETNNDFKLIKTEFETKKDEQNYDFGKVWMPFSSDFYSLIKNTYNPDME